MRTDSQSPWWIADYREGANKPNDFAGIDGEPSPHLRGIVSGADKSGRLDGCLPRPIAAGLRRLGLTNLDTII
jgi:hypothetical protein